MAVRVRGDKSKDVELYLEDTGEGTVYLKSGDDDFTLAEISTEGIVLIGGISSTFGIATDEDGEIVLLP